MEKLQKIARLILVVEDEVLIRICTVLDLQEAGYPVVDAADAKEALLVFGEHPEITTVFTDINMPGAFDGLALVQMIFEQRPSVQIIVTSGRAEPRQNEMPAGARFLAKPYSCGALLALIGDGRSAEPPSLLAIDGGAPVAFSARADEIQPLVA